MPTETVLTKAQQELLWAFYDCSRIPIWIFSPCGELLSCFCSSAIREKQELMLKVLSQIAVNAEKEVCLKQLPAEYYCGFSLESIEIVCGPVLADRCYSTLEAQTLSFAEGIPDSVMELTDHLPISHYSEFLRGIRLLTLSLGLKLPQIDQAVNALASSQIRGSRSLLIQELFHNQEEASKHTPFAEELALLECVKSGSTDRLFFLYNALPETKYGKMSSQPLKSLFYGSIANTTLITRYAIMGGMDEEAAFSLSDLYIRKLEQCSSIRELKQINEQMAIDFTTRVSEARSRKENYSEIIAQCVSFIRHNTHRKLTLSQAAQELNLTPKYLSYLFRKETGQTFQSYVMSEKVQEAQLLLRFSQYTCNEISEFLGFSSQSHFISVFKKYTRCTPIQYKSQRQSELEET